MLMFVLWWALNHADTFKHSLCFIKQLVCCSAIWLWDSYPWNTLIVASVCSYLAANTVPPSCFLSGRPDSNNSSAGNVHHYWSSCSPDTSAHSWQSDDETSQAPLRWQHPVWSDWGTLVVAVDLYQTDLLVRRLRFDFCLLRSPWPSSLTPRCASRDSRKPRVTPFSPCRLTRIRTLLS